MNPDPLSFVEMNPDGVFYVEAVVYLLIHVTFLKLNPETVFRRRSYNKILKQCVAG